MMTSNNRFVAAAMAGLVLSGCIVEEHHHRVAPVAEVTVAGPVFEAPGVEVVSVEPAPPDRVYIYDPGFPPGVYFYNDYYWYNGYRYPRDVFVQRYVNVNVREHRYIDRESNRRMGAPMEVRQREEFTRTRGVHGKPVHDDHRDVEHRPY
jgi:hypothetical protein